MRKIWALLLLILTTCTPPENFEQLPTPTTTIFTATENKVTNQSNLVFNLEKEGIYTLTLLNGTQVITREKFTGKIGRNTLKLYTRALQNQYLYLVLQDANNNQIGKTTLIIE
jgi:predicted transcriptional regulator